MIAYNVICHSAHNIYKHAFCNTFLPEAFLKIETLFKASDYRLCHTNLCPPWQVLFFGTDDFSIKSLNMLYTELVKGSLLKRLEVVTSPKSKNNPVRQFAENKQLRIHDWPITPLKGQFDLGLVVSFGHLIPQNIIASFPLGMLNVHASLLPRWRGAAPIIHAIMHGDKETGVTIMQILPHKFDIGGILYQSRYAIPEHSTLLEVSQHLAIQGSEDLLRSIESLPHCLDKIHPQAEEEVTYAPRVSAAVAEINWQEMDATRVYNLHRALKGLFALSTKWQGLSAKLHNVSIVPDSELHLYGNYQNVHPGYTFFNKRKKMLFIKCADGWITVGAIVISGKKLSAIDFHNGYLSKTPQQEWFFT